MYKHIKIILSKILPESRNKKATLIAQGGFVKG
jgi:hypothetical protein